MAKRVIWKFPLKAAGVADVEMPQGALTLNVQAQGDIPMLWAVCDPEAPIQTRRFRSVLTGEPFDLQVTWGPTYHGTVQMDGGQFVVHVFEETWSR